MVDENKRVKQELREAKLENAKLKLDAERSSKDAERSKRHAEIKKWKDTKNQPPPPPPSNVNKLNVTGGNNSKEMQLTIDKLKKNLALSSRTSSLYEMGCVGMSGLFPSPVDGVMKGGAIKVKEVRMNFVNVLFQFTQLFF